MSRLGQTTAALQPATPDRRTSAAPRVLAIVVGVFLLSGAFGLAAPLGSAPDEPDHWRYAWGVVDGQDPSTGEVVVPQALAGYPGACFNELPETSAGCAAGITDGEEPVDAATSALLYPSLYYRLVSWPLLLSSSTTGLLGVRMLSAAVSAVFWGLAFAPWLGRGNWLVRAGVLLALTPSALYFGGMITPQGLELASLAAAWSLTLRVLFVLRNGGYRDLPRWLQVAWPAVLVVACMTRVLSWWWVVVVVAACWVAVRPPLQRTLRDRGALIALAVVVLTIATRAAIFLLQSFTWNVVDSLGTPVDLPLWQLTISTLWRALDDPADAVGLLGWLDTDVPSLSTGVWFVLLGVVVGLVATRVRTRHVAACALTAVALLGTWIVLDPYLTQAGGIPFWQPRYGLGVAIGIPILLAGAAVDRPSADPVRLIRVLAGWSVVGGWMLALGYLLVRYMWSAHWFGPVGPPTWSPYLPSYVLLPVALGAAALTAHAITSGRAADPAPPARPEAAVPTSPPARVREGHG